MPYTIPPELQTITDEIADCNEQAALFSKRGDTDTAAYWLARADPLREYIDRVETDLAELRHQDLERIDDAERRADAARLDDLENNLETAQPDRKKLDEYRTMIEAENATPLSYQIDPTENPPPLLWTIDRWMPQADVTLLAGPAGTGKSRLALQIAAAVACYDGYGLPAIPGAIFNVTTGGRVLFASWEDKPDSIRRRMHELNESGPAWINPTALAERIEFINLRGQGSIYGPSPTGTPGPLPLFEQITARIPTDAGLFVLDTIGKAFTGNENARNEVDLFLDLLTGLADQYGISILALSHPSKTANVSGSTAWENCRAVWLLKSDADRQLTLVHRKVNDAIPQADVTLHADGWPYRYGPHNEPTKKAGSKRAKQTRND